MMQLEAGLRGVITHIVVDTDLATNWRNDVPVLATPILLWLAELASMRAIDNCLNPGQMTLGYGHDVKHMAPTPEGWKVRIEAELVAIDGRILNFAISASDDQDVVLTGWHSRVIVDRERFVTRIRSKMNS